MEDEDDDDDNDDNIMSKGFELETIIKSNFKK